MEIIKDIEGFEGRYTISNLGIIRSIILNKIMKPYITNKGYARINLRYAHSRKYKSILVHRIVAKAFIENPNNYKEINHKDCNRLNNSSDNLEWCTRFYNIKYAFEKGRASNKGVKNPNSKLNEIDVKAIKALIETRRFYITDIAKLFKVSRSTIQMIEKNKTWSDN